jgi:hypothetical protein
MKKITLLFLFMVGSISTSFGQFTEGFEAGIPATWTVINGGDANTWAANTFTPHGGLGDASIGYSGTAHDDHLITPAITVTAGLNDRISFWVRSRDPDYPEVFSVLLSSTTPTAGAFTTVLEADVAPTSGALFYQYTYNLTAHIGQTVYISFYSSTTDQFRLDIDDFVNDAIPSVVPNCAANPVSAPSATCGNFASTLSWDAAPTASGYNLTVGTTSGGTEIVNNENIGNVLTYTLPTQTPGTAYFWKVVPYNVVGNATGCTENNYTTFATGCYCVSLPTSNDNLGITNILVGSTNVPNGDVTYSDYTSTVVNFLQGVSSNVQITFATGYTYDTNIWIDFNNDFDFDDAGELVQTGIASTATNPTTLDASFVMPLTAAIGQHRMRIGTADDGQTTPNACYSDVYGVTLDFTVNVSAPTADLPDYANLQWPPTATFIQGGNVTIYGQVYEGGLTDVVPNIVGQAPGISAWIGYSATDTNPNTWTNWTTATWNSTSVGNNDEYQATIGAALPVGTYYYATRFQLNTGLYVYGGIDNSNNGNFWDGTTYKSGVLTVTAIPAPANDECAGATALTPGGVFATNAVTGTSVSATDTDGLIPSCQANFTSNVWYSVVVPASGNITIETQAEAGSGYTDSVITAFSGTCGALTAINCDDDLGTGFFSLLALTGQTPGATLYVSVWRYSLGAGVDGTFKISAYDASLGNNSFDSANFAYYPNPVKNTLNLSYTKEISNVEVFNLLGQKVSSNVINANDAQIDMSNLSKGAYMVKVTSDNQVKTVKVIKE